ncbi:unnamed protein product, partial [Polarella glacialis]
MEAAPGFTQSAPSHPLGRRSTRRSSALPVLTTGALVLLLCLPLQHDSGLRHLLRGDEVLPAQSFVGPRLERLVWDLRRATSRSGPEGLAARAVQNGIEFDPNSIIDRTELSLIGTTFRLTSSIFGFPDFQSLIELDENGNVTFSGGMISQGQGGWSVVEGDPEENESPE